MGSPLQVLLPTKPYLATLAFGCAFALLVSTIWDMEFRWGVIVLVGLAGIGLCMSFARVFSDFIVVVSIAALPILSFCKWFLIEDLTEDERGNVVYSGTFGIGPLDILLLIQYINLFYRLFVVRTDTLPKLTLVDFFVIWFLIANVISTIGAPNPLYGFGVVTFLLKYSAFYFFLSRTLEPRHLPWILAAFGLTLALETALGLYQVSSGKLLGVALDKGAGGEEMSYQYMVPGTEGKYRATGTCYDSHCFGLFISMIMFFPLVLALTKWIKTVYRQIFLLATLTALVMIFFSLSRSAWIATAISLTAGIFIIPFHWGERHLLRYLVMLGLLIAITSPVTIEPIYDRFINSPWETLSTRFDQYSFGLDIWLQNFFFGFGAGNWLIALRERDNLWLEVLLVHNVILLTAAETGIVGAIGFIGTVGAAIWRLYAVVRMRRDLVGRFALAALLALITSVGTGMTDPTLREPNTFGLYWLMIALSVALPRMPKDGGGFLATSERSAGIPQELTR
jgi:O-antigen ligase